MIKRLVAVLQQAGELLRHLQIIASAETVTDFRPVITGIVADRAGKNLVQPVRGVSVLCQKFGSAHLKIEVAVLQATNLILQIGGLRKRQTDQLRHMGAQGEINLFQFRNPAIRQVNPMLLFGQICFPVLFQRGAGK